MTIQEPQAKPTKEDFERAFAQRLAAGQAAFQAGRLGDAVKIFAELARSVPTHPTPHANLGMMLRRLGKFEAALASYQRALALAPDNPSIMSSVGNAYRALGKLTEAEKLQARAVQLAPGDYALLYNHALTLRDMRKINEAQRMLQALADEKPDDPEVAWDLAITHLQLGDYVKGFKGYEARWRLQRNGTKLHEGPHWAGEDIAGKRILIQSEQGFGDAIQFARFIPLVAARGARIVLECAAELKPLFATIPGVEEIVVRGQPVPPVDLSIPLLSLPRVFGTSLGTIPAQVPYLRAPQTVAIQRHPGTLLNVGLIWAGKPTPRDRSWPITMLAGLMEDPHIVFFSLQTGPRARELAENGLDKIAFDMSPHLKDFAVTAAVMNALDLIVTIDTAGAHLAGALGRPVCVLLRYVSDWRWHDYRDDSPWYPSMRLFRQQRPDDFQQPVDRVRDSIRQLAERAAQRPAAG